MQPVVFIGRGLFSSLRLWEAVKIAEKLRLYNLYFILQVHVCSLMSYARQAAVLYMHQKVAFLSRTHPHLKDCKLHRKTWRVRRTIHWCAGTHELTG